MSDGKRLRLVTTRHTPLVRIFNNATFDHGGRLFKGWWLHLSKRDRFAQIRMDGERIAECDYTSMYLRLAYHAAGVAWPFSRESDPYLCGAFDSDQERAGLKTCTLALLNGGKGRQFPADAQEMFGAGTRPSDVYMAIRAKHERLQRAGAFGSIMGHQLARAESDLMLALLARLQADGLSALPIHDAVVCPTTQGPRVAEAMEQAAWDVLGCELPVIVRWQAEG